ncbi:MAG: hypothetical protein JO112_17920 [Planctomycetes bacterium]|nr:hypothetical protein [Planctomycetota bacterium]
METNGQPRNTAADGYVLRWPGRVLAATDVRHHLNGHRELILSPSTILTPLAVEELRARGVRITRKPVETDTPVSPTSLPTWAFAQDRPHGLVSSAVQAVRRDGLSLKELPAPFDPPCHWAKAIAECVARGECQGGVVFAEDPGLICCVANKVAGMRAMAVVSVAQAARAALSLGPNLVAVEMPGRTFFEVRQILRLLCLSVRNTCPDGVACTLQELDGHAHR